MPITNGAYVNPGWVNDTNPYINQTEMNAISNTLAKVPISNGGTGATTASDALTNLGAEPKANVAGAGSSNTPVFFDSNGVAYAITSPISASLGGTGVSSLSALVTSIKAVTYSSANTGSATQPVYVNNGVATACTYTLAKSVPSNAVFTDTTALGSMTGTLAVSHGGTGTTSVAGIVSALKAVTQSTAGGTVGSATQPVYVKDGVATVCTYTLAKSVPSTAVFTDTTALGSMTGTLAIAHGGTGATTVAAARNNLGLGNTAGALPIANGGTGTTTAAGIVTAIKAVTQSTAGATVGGETTPVYIKNGVATACSTTLKTYTGTSPITVSGTAISHANSGVTAASKGDTANQTPAFGGTFKVPSGTVNATGHLTAFADHTVTIPSTTATTSRNGLMTSAYATKLEAIGTVVANSFSGTVAASTAKTVSITLPAGTWIINARWINSVGSGKGGVVQLSVGTGSYKVYQTTDCSANASSAWDEGGNATTYHTPTSSTTVSAQYYSSVAKSVELSIWAIRVK